MITFAMSPLRGTTAAALCLAVSSPAAAHFSFDADTAHQARDGSQIKNAPCGAANSTRGSTVHTYRPGETINITISEWIPHPGYFRIAFDADGTDDFVVPSGTEGAGAGADCNNDPNCGKPENADYCNSPAVMWDNLDLHGTGEGGDRTWSVTLPNIECDNCTLQVIQMMNDLQNHGEGALFVENAGPYPQGDLYYGCIDIVLANDADEVDVTPVTNNGMQCDTFDAAATMGGASTGGTTGGTTGATTDGTTGGSSTGGVTTTTSPTVGTGDGGVATGTTGGTTAGTTAGTTGVTGAATAGTTAPPATSDSGGCSVGPGPSQRTGIAAALWLMGLFGLLWMRRARG